MRECGRLAVCGPCSLLYSSPFLSVTLHEGGTTRAWTIQGRCSSQLLSVGALRRSRATNSLVRRCSCGLGRRLGPVPWRVPWGKSCLEGGWPRWDCKWSLDPLSSPTSAWQARGFAWRIRRRQVVVGNTGWLGRAIGWPWWVHHEGWGRSGVVLWHRAWDASVGGGSLWQAAHIMVALAGGGSALAPGGLLSGYTVSVQAFVGGGTIGAGSLAGTMRGVAVGRRTTTLGRQVGQGPALFLCECVAGAQRRMAYKTGSSCGGQHRVTRQVNRVAVTGAPRRWGPGGAALWHRAWDGPAGVGSTGQAAQLVLHRPGGVGGSPGRARYRGRVAVSVVRRAVHQRGQLWPLHRRATQRRSVLRTRWQRLVPHPLCVHLPRLALTPSGGRPQEV